MITMQAKLVYDIVDANAAPEASSLGIKMIFAATLIISAIVEIIRFI